MNIFVNNDIDWTGRKTVPKVFFRYPPKAPTNFNDKILNGMSGRWKKGKKNPWVMYCKKINILMHFIIFL